MSRGTLYVVATPIGNLGDITLRAIKILKQTPVLACEDTRHSKKLLSHLGIVPAHLLSLHKFNERSRAGQIRRHLEEGRDVALLSDAGTPGLCDPGQELIAQLAAEGLRIVPLPGPSALTAALSASGLPSDQFVFDGFLPRKTAERRKRLEALLEETRTLVFFEVPHRCRESLQDMAEILGPRRATMARELSKLHETLTHADLVSLAQDFSGAAARGEIVLMVQGSPVPGTEKEAIADGALDAALSQCRQEGLSQKDAVRRVAGKFGVPRNRVYRRALSAGR